MAQILAKKAKFSVDSLFPKALKFPCRPERPAPVAGLASENDGDAIEDRKLKTLTTEAPERLHPRPGRSAQNDGDAIEDRKLKTLTTEAPERLHPRPGRSAQDDGGAIDYFAKASRVIKLTGNTCVLISKVIQLIHLLS